MHNKKRGCKFLKLFKVQRVTSIFTSIFIFIYFNEFSFPRILSKHRNQFESELKAYLATNVRMNVLERKNGQSSDTCGDYQFCE